MSNSLEKTTIQQANDKSFPTDARLIWYKVNGTEYVDLTRCRKTVELFDMYYDKYGKGAVQRIDFGYGSVNPKLWDTNQRSRRKRKSSMDQLTSQFQIMKMRKEIKVLHEEIRELRLMLGKQTPDWCHPESAINFLIHILLTNA